MSSPPDPAEILRCAEQIRVVQQQLTTLLVLVDQLELQLAALRHQLRDGLH